MKYDVIKSTDQILSTPSETQDNAKIQNQPDAAGARLAEPTLLAALCWGTLKLLIAIPLLLTMMIWMPILILGYGDDYETKIHDLLGKALEWPAANSGISDNDGTTKS